jgi:uncharacterized protein (TIGR03790 family)
MGLNLPLPVIAAMAAVGTLAYGQGPANVLVVVNQPSAFSRDAAQYYVQRRHIPAQNVCRIKASVAETVSRDMFDKEIAAPVAACLRSAGLVESVLYIVTMPDVPLRVRGAAGMSGDNASVDSELTLLYQTIHGRRPPSIGSVPNPFFGKRDARFRHPDFAMYLVTRLAGYDLACVRALVDRSLAAKNRGKFVIDSRNDRDGSGDRWLRDAAILLPSERVVFDESESVMYGQKDVIGYASWGSNDGNRKQRRLGFQWLPGAVMTEFVSTNARTFERPPETWNISSWKTPHLWFKGSPQTLTGDYLVEGATGASGHVDEPYLGLSPRPDHLLPAWYSGRTLAEAYYLAIPGLSWQNVVIGDPLCTLGSPSVR